MDEVTQTSSAKFAAASNSTNAGTLKASLPKFIMLARSGDTSLVAPTITTEYLDAARKLAANTNSKEKPEQAVLSDFNYYTIRQIDRVVTDGNAALVEATVEFDKSELPDLRQEEKEAMESGQECGTLFTTMGGSSKENTFEKDGVGKATFYFISQSSGWKLHYTYFTLGAMRPEQEREALSALRLLAD